MAKNKEAGITNDQILNELSQVIKQMSSKFKNSRIKQADKYDEIVDLI